VAESKRAAVPVLGGASVSRPRWVALAGLALTVLVLVTASVVGGAAAPPTLSDPGPVTRWGLLVARAAYDLAGLATVGLLLVSVMLMPGAGAGFGADAVRLTRVASRWAAAWCVCAVLTWLFTVAQVMGVPVWAAPDVDLVSVTLQLETTRALLSTVWLAGLVAVASRMTASPGAVFLLLVFAVSGLVLPVLTGHAGHGSLPALTATSLAVHVVAVSAWVGGLGAVVLHLRRSHGALAVVLPRYSRLALGCFVAVGLSGVVTGWPSFTTVDQGWTTSYGQLLLGKLVALVLLGSFGFRHRRGTVAAVVQRRPWAFVQVAATELIVMACTTALAVALANTAPPSELQHASDAPLRSSEAGARGGP